MIDSYITAAIEYGIEIGHKQANNSNQENEHYESQYHKEVRNPKLVKYFKAQRQASKEMHEALSEVLGYAEEYGGLAFAGEHGKTRDYFLQAIGKAQKALALADNKEV